MRDDEILTTSDAARMLGVSGDGVRWLVAQGRLPAMRTVGGQRLFNRSDVEQLAARRDAIAHARQDEREHAHVA